MKIAKIQDKNTLVIYCSPINKVDYLVSIGYQLAGYTEYEILEDKAKQMINDFNPIKDFDFIRNNWLPIFTTNNMRNKFNKQMNIDSKIFENDLKLAEYWNPGSIKTNGYLNALINNRK